MPSFTTQRRVLHSAQNMFDLVADVSAYPQFVPLCESLTVRTRGREGDFDVLVADMSIAYKVIRESFTSRVTLHQDASQILVEYLDGPFEHMENRWTFRAIGPLACDVEFFIDYEFNSKALRLVMGKLFDKAFRKFSAAFEARADHVYGTGRLLQTAGLPSLGGRPPADGAY